nr:DLA class II histocompatibility antigen, DR-1 beta chain-like [Vicugna pacos]
MWIGGGSQCPFEWDLPTPITRYLLLISSMVCLYFSGGSWMAALTVILMVLSPSLVWTKNTQSRYRECGSFHPIGLKFIKQDKGAHWPPGVWPQISLSSGAQSESAQSKMLSGIGGFVLGLLFLGVGLFIYFRNQKGHSGLQPTGLLS